MKDKIKKYAVKIDQERFMVYMQTLSMLTSELTDSEINELNILRTEIGKVTKGYNHKQIQLVIHQIMTACYLIVDDETFIKNIKRI